MYSKVQPQVLTTSPHNYENEVSTTGTITITFNTVLHRKHINDSLVVRYYNDIINNEVGPILITVVHGSISYENKVLTFTPQEPLLPGMVYHVTVISNPDSGVGVRSVLEDFMLTPFNFTFTTAGRSTIAAITLLSPTNNTVLKDTPTFSWKNQNECMYYHIEVARTNTFSSIFWTYPIDNSLISSPLIPGTHFDPLIFKDDGIYYWRVRGHGWHGEVGDFSSISEFNITRTEFASVTIEDTNPTDPAVPEYEVPISEGPEIIWPELGFSNVATNLRSLVFTVDEKIDVLKLNAESFVLIGEAVNGDTSTSHGEVNGVLQVQELINGKTIIVFTPDTQEVIL